MWFLLFLAGVYLLIASVLDLKTREIPNWLSFSLIAFALAFRLIYSLFSSDFSFFFFGLFGFSVFFILAYLFYYSRVFAGGDAKLLMAVGAVIPVASTLKLNLILLLSFIFLLLFIGSFYGLIFSIFIVVKNKKKFIKKFNKKIENKIFLFSLVLAFVGLALSLYFYFILFNAVVFIIPLIFFFFPFLFIYSKAVEEVMIKEVESKNLTVGDWLYEEVKIGGEKISPNWQGLDDEEVLKLKKNKKKVKVKQGIPFVPAFFFAFIFFVLWYSFWNFLQFFSFFA